MANGTLAVSQLEMLTQSGTGIITVVPPATNTNRTLTLPDATGTVVASGTTPSLNGIAFPATQVSSADANTLDDYEEGTWTPSFTLDSGSATAIAASGSYVKIGKQVSLIIYISFSVPSAASINEITGFPFTSENTLQRGAGALRENSNTGNMWQFRSNPNTTIGLIRRYDNSQVLADAMIFVGTLTYFTT